MIGENLALEEANMMMEHLEDQCRGLRGSLVRIHSFLDGNCLTCQSFVSPGSGRLHWHVLWLWDRSHCPESLGTRGLELTGA